LNKLFFAIFFILSASSISLAQSNYSIIGDGAEIVFIFRIKVVDTQSHWPLSNAKITMRDQPNKVIIFSVSTDQNGTAAVLVKEKVGNMPGGKIEVIHPEYFFYEKEYLQHDLIRNSKNNRILIPASSSKDDDSIINAVSSENFRRIGKDITGMGGETFKNVGDFIEINVEMKMLDRITMIKESKGDQHAQSNETIDGRFTAYANGTVKESERGLMWAARDNGHGVTWQEAKEYCENYRGGGYKDWRMPTTEELRGLYDENRVTGQIENVNIHVTHLIKITGFWVWSSDTKSRYAGVVALDDGLYQYHTPDNKYRALPVRSGK